MVSFHEAFNVATLTYSIPAIVIYAIFLNILFKKRHSVYATAFYDHIRLLGIVDLFVYIGFFGVFRAGHFSVLFPIYENFLFLNWISTIWLYVTAVFQNSQHFIHLLIAFNRFCVIVFAFSNQRCLKRFFKVSAVVIFLGPAIYMGWILFAEAKVWRYSVPSGMQVWYAVDNWKPWGKDTVSPSKGKLFAIVGGICYSLSFLFNICTVIKITLLKSKNHVDVRLFIISLMLFFTTLIHCVFYVFLTFAKSSTAEFVYYYIVPLQCLTYDLATLSTPFCFMLLSSSLRKNVFQIIMLNKNESTAVTIISKSNNNNAKPKSIMKISTS